MPRGTKFTAEQIIGKSREAEVGLAQGKPVPEVVRKLGVTERTYYCWKREYGGVRTDQAKRLKDLEKENARLKRLLADAELEKAILREAKVLIERWRKAYNTVRPHSSLGYEPQPRNRAAPVRSLRLRLSNRTGASHWHANPGERNWFHQWGAGQQEPFGNRREMAR